MPHYIVTGSAGFLGYHLANTLSNDPSNDVTCVDNFCRGEPDTLYEQLIGRPNVTHFGVDLNDMAAVRSLPKTADVVFHMAALNGTQNFYERPFDVVRSCTLPTLNLLEHYGPQPPSRFVYAGTSEAYASTVTRFGWPVPTAEDVPLSIDDVFNARWSYGGSKMHGEIATIAAGRHFDLPYTIIRFHNAYGPRMGDKHVIPDFLTRAKEGRFELFGHSDTRSFIYAQDAVNATIALSANEEASGQVVNVGGANEIEIGALGHLMMRVCGFEGEIVLHDSPSGSVKRRAPALQKMIDLVGRHETIGLEEGLRLTADFYLGRGTDD